MFFPDRTKKRMKGPLAGLAVCAVLAVGVTAAFFSPDDEGAGFAISSARWVMAVSLGMAVCMAIDLVGTWCLDRPFWQRLSSWTRIALLVALACLVMAGCVLARSLLQAWGSA